MRILLVDDDINIIKALSKGLILLGHDVLAAENGSQALEIVRNATPDMIITDIFMPEMDGFELMRAVRQEYPGLPVIALSGGGAGLSPDLFLRMTQKLGVTRTLLKPCSLTEVAMAIDDSIPGRDATMQARA